MYIFHLFGSHFPPFEIFVDYDVHMDHGAAEDCLGEDETLVNLEEFLSMTELLDLSSLGSRFSGTVVSTAFLKTQEFLKCIVRSPGSELMSEHFQLMLNFTSNGIGKVLGCIWPEELNALNLDYASNGKISEPEEFILFIERNICTTSDINLLRKLFNLSEIDAESFVKLVQKYQIHLCDATDCVRCSHPELPSLETELADITSCTQNVKTSLKFKNYMKNELVSLSNEEKRTLTTADWLNQVWDTANGEVTVDGLLMVSFSETKICNFVKEIAAKK